MTKRNPAGGASDGPRRTTTIERTYKASLDDVWGLWTTKEGIESWWAPDGFSVEVRSFDARTGGAVVYAMTATDPAQVEFVKSAGLPLTTEARFVYAEVVAKRRLVLTHRIDFVPGVPPYEVSTAVDFHASGQDVRVVVTLSAMHDDAWTQRAAMGWESQLGKLAKALGA